MSDINDIRNPFFLNKYKKWKRDNVTVRGIKEMGKHNGVFGSYGEGLYTAPLSNAKYARGYGKLYFVVGAKPKHPFKAQYSFNIETYIYNKMKELGYSNIGELERAEGIAHVFTMDGYDGIYLQGAEYVNFKPDEDNIKYFEYSNEDELKYYYLANFHNVSISESLIPTFEEYSHLNENNSKYNTLVVCDIQPEYEEYFTFNLDDFLTFIEDYDTIYYFYNGVDLGMSEEYEVVEWLIENGCSEDLIETITFIDKTYGYYRDMISEYGLETTTNIVKYLYDNNIESTNDIGHDDLVNTFGNNVANSLNRHGGYYLYDIIIDSLKYTNNIVICGGGKDECLAELMIDIKVSNKSYILANNFIY